MTGTRTLTETVDRQTISLLEQLTPEQWQAPSLCAHWTITGVVGHLISGSRTPLPTFGRDVLRRRGHFHRASEAGAARHIAHRTPADLLEHLSRQAGRPGGAARLLPSRLLLGDHLVHLLDIAVAVGHEITIDPEAVAMVLATQLALPNPFIPRLANGLSLATTDLAWTPPHRRAGGLPISGTCVDLLVALAGRDATLPRLSGPGADVLARRIQVWKTSTDQPFHVAGTRTPLSDPGARTTQPCPATTRWRVPSGVEPPSVPIGPTVVLASQTDSPKEVGPVGG